MTDAHPTQTRASTKRHILVGLIATGVLVIAVAGWAGGTKLAGAVIANGFVVVESEVKKVQHPEGGIVGELNVRGGARVEQGEVVLRLDATQTKADLGVITKRGRSIFSRPASMAAATTSGFMTMPGPPPYGRSSTER